MLPIDHSFFDYILELGLDMHLNTSFKHFIFFVKEHKLVPEKELEPMRDLIEKFESTDMGRGTYRFEKGTFARGEAAAMAMVK